MKPVYILLVSDFRARIKDLNEIMYIYYLCIMYTFLLRYKRADRWFCSQWGRWDFTHYRTMAPG